MADALASTSTSPAPVEPQEAVKLVQRALSANQALQHELTKRAEELEAKIKEVDKILDALENDTSPKDPEDEVQILGARKASSLFNLAECFNINSPFREEALKRADYAARITPQSFNPKQLEGLKHAVRSENQKLQAYRIQTGDHATVDLERNVDGINWDIVAEKVSDVSSDGFSADQCRIKWVGDRHPSFNHSEWKAPEIQTLLKLVEEAKEISTEPLDWVEITKQLETGRTVLDTMSHGQPRERHCWDHISDQKLLKAVEKHGLNNWMTVARETSENATPTQCQNRYKKSLDPTIKRGTWTAVEDTRLKKAVEAFGSSWVRVAEFVAGRTNDQCNERWTGQLNANSSKNVWSDEEDKMLFALANSLGKQWKMISEKVGNGKTGPSCRLRFNKLVALKKGSPTESSPQSPIQESMSPGSPETHENTKIIPETTSLQAEQSNTPAGPFTPTDEVAATKSQRKKRKKQADPNAEDKFQPKRRCNKFNAAPDVHPYDPNTTASTDSGVEVHKPRPVAKKSKTVESSQSAASGSTTTRLPHNATVAGQWPILEAYPTESSPAGRRRSARVGARSRGDDGDA